MIQSMKLARFCEGNDVVMAMPKGMSGGETAILARPILGDPKVVEMLRPCGINLKLPKSNTRSNSSGSKLSKISEDGGSSSSLGRKVRGGTAAVVAEKSKSTSSMPTILLGVVITSLLLFTAHRHIRITRPIQSGQVLLPGQWKSRCGIWELIPIKNCDLSKSSKLEMGKDGKLRYYSKGASGDLKETWSVGGGGNVAECVAGEDGEEDGQCVKESMKGREGAKFVNESGRWYVEMSGSRSLLNRDVAREFTS